MWFGRQLSVGQLTTDSESRLLCKYWRDGVMNDDETEVLKRGVDLVEALNS